MRIGIDARFYGPVGKGLGRYTQEVVDNVIRIAAADPRGAAREFVVFLSPDNYEGFSCPDRVKKVLVEAHWYSWKEQISLPWLFWHEHLDLLHIPHFNVPLLTPCPFVVTIHDLILTHFPTQRATTLSPWLYRIKNLAYRLVIKTAIRRARKIITVSEFTKNDLIGQFGVPASRIAVTYEGVADLSRGPEAGITAAAKEIDILEKYRIGRLFLLYVGNAYPHKNLEILLESFSLLLKKYPEIRLILVGKDDYFYSRIKERAACLGFWREDDPDSPVVFPGYVSDNQLERLYRAAAAYVFPSLYEGFGLPPLEAMARSCPVLSSDRSSLPEILGPAALYFDPENKDDLAAKAISILDDEDKRRDFIDRGLEQAKSYSWLECARQTWAIYLAALKKK